jgi:hypothetical protein
LTTRPGSQVTLKGAKRLLGCSPKKKNSPFGTIGQTTPPSTVEEVSVRSGMTISLK